MRLLIADRFEASGLAGLAQLGLDVEYLPELTEEGLVEAVRASRPEVLVVRSTRVAEAVMVCGPLRLIIRAGAGYNTIDVAAASRRGIYVANCPGKNAIAVAELAFGLMIALDRRIPEAVASIRACEWMKQELSTARGLFGTTLGLIGLGCVGREMVVRAAAFGMTVFAWSRSLTEPGAAALGVVRVDSLIELAQQCDIVSVHLALNPDTRSILNSAFFQAMRPGTYFVNTSRAELVDHSALSDALALPGIRVAVDVYEHEPTGGSDVFFDDWVHNGNVYGTPHIAGSTNQAQEAIAAETVRVVSTFRDTGRVPSAVNLAERSPATHVLSVRHRDRPGVLAHVLDAIKAAEINVQEMENVVFAGADAALARVHMDGELSIDDMERMRSGNWDIIDVSQQALSLGSTV